MSGKKIGLMIGGGVVLTLAAAAVVLYLLYREKPQQLSDDPTEKGAVEEIQKEEETLQPVSWNNGSTQSVTKLYKTGALAKDVLSSPAKISGAMPGFWYFEAQAQVKLLDQNRKVVATGLATATSEWMQTGLVPFETTLKFSTPDTATGFLVLEADNPSGLSENEKSETYQVVFWPGILVYFNDSVADPNMLDCSKVYSAPRQIRPTLAVARAALEELLKGPDVTSKFEKNMITNIQPGVKIQSLSINNGVARVDFSEELERGVGGSCKTAAIRAQIEQTLKQFPTVQNVVISINGRTEDILQP